MVRKKNSKPEVHESDSFNEALAIAVYSNKEFVPPAIAELVSWRNRLTKSFIFSYPGLSRAHLGAEPVGLHTYKSPK